MKKRKETHKATAEKIQVRALPQIRVRKFPSWIKWLFIIVSIIVAGVVLINYAGKLFIGEVTQELKFKELENVTMAGIDKRAPDFDLVSLEGENVRLADYLGRPTVLMFWTTWNVMSADQMKIFDDYLSKPNKNLFEIVTVSSLEDKSALANFIKRGGYKVKVLLDENGTVAEKYQARNLPASYYIDKEGVLRDVY